MKCDRCHKELGKNYPLQVDEGFLRHMQNEMVCIEEILCIDCQRKFMKNIIHRE
jgi:hypothetical protein